MAISVRVALALELVVSESSIKITVIENRRLHESAHRQLEGKWTVDFIVTVPVENQGVVEAKLTSIERDPSNLSDAIESELKNAGVSPAVAAIKIEGFRLELPTTTFVDARVNHSQVQHPCSHWVVVFLAVLVLRRP